MVWRFPRMSLERESRGLIVVRWPGDERRGVDELLVTSDGKEERGEGEE